MDLLPEPPLKTLQQMDEMFAEMKIDHFPMPLPLPLGKPPILPSTKMVQKLFGSGRNEIGLPRGPVNPALKDGNFQVPDQTVGGNLLYPVPVIKHILSKNQEGIDLEELNERAMKAEAKELYEELFSLDSYEETSSDESVDLSDNETDGSKKRPLHSLESNLRNDMPERSFKAMQLENFLSDVRAQDKLNAQNYLDEMSEADSIDNYKDIKKQIVQVGREYEAKPKKGDQCHISVYGTISNGTIIDECYNHPVSVGRMDICMGIDIGLQTMHVGECARFEIAPSYTYNKCGPRTGVAHDATIWYIVKLYKVVLKGSEELTKPKTSIHPIFPITQTSDTYVLKHFMEYYFVMMEARGNSWFYEITLEAVVVTPLETLQKIASVELLMKDYKYAEETVNYILKHGGRPDKETKFLKDSVNFFLNHKKETKVVVSKKRTPEHPFWFPIPKLPINRCKIPAEEEFIPLTFYLEVRKIKRLALHTLKVLQEKQELSFLGQVLWALGLGAGTFSLGVAAKKFLF